MTLFLIAHHYIYRSILLSEKRFMFKSVIFEFLKTKPLLHNLFPKGATNKHLPFPFQQHPEYDSIEAHLGELMSLLSLHTEHGWGIDYLQKHGWSENSHSGQPHHHGEDFHIDGVPLQLTLPVYLRYSSSLEEASRITKSDTVGCLLLLLTIAILMKMMVVMLRNNSLQKAYSNNQWQ